MVEEEKLVLSDVLLQRLENLIDCFKGKRVLIIGDLMIDHYIFGEVNRVSREAPVPIVDLHKELRKLGGAANLINNIVALGGKPYAIGVIGDDKDGEWLLKELRQRRVDVSGILVDRKRPTTTKTRIMAGHHQLLRVDQESRENVSSEVMRELMFHVKKIVPEVSCVVLSDYDKGLLTAKTVDYTITTACSYDTPVVADPKPRYFIDYAKAFLIKTNLYDASLATGVSPINETSLLNMALNILSHLRPKGILITRGKNGMSLFEDTGNIMHMYPLLDSDFYDVTGVRDTMSASISLAVSSEASLREAAILSNVAAAIKGRKMGTSTVRNDEMIVFLKNKEGLTLLSNITTSKME
jgi:D-beta-D-heptose 7-phosphate kinase/D-beta-D-heptose 1-phosphate adenosyltransferase